MPFQLFNDPTMQGLGYALNALSERQQVIANNISNVQTPGYQAQDVTFEDQLAGILQGQTNSTPDSTGSIVESPDISTGIDGNTVDMESEMAKMSETNLMYNSLAQLTVDRLGILKTAITG